MLTRTKLCSSVFDFLRHPSHTAGNLSSRSFILSSHFTIPRGHCHGGGGGGVRFPASRVSCIHAYYSTEKQRGGRPASACWNCSAASPFLVCSSCRSVQPVDPFVDYFRIFSLERKYDIELGNIEGMYKDWQKKLHPDLVHSKSEKEKAFAADQSCRVIDAYRTLSKPLTRALYLMHLEDVHINEEKIITNPDLLAEMMDLREAVDEATDSQALKQIESQIRVKFDESSKSFDEAFKKQDFGKAISAIQRMRYYERATEEIVKKI